jgi:hypothetical protein
VSFPEANFQAFLWHGRSLRRPRFPRLDARYPHPSKRKGRNSAPTEATVRACVCPSRLVPIFRLRRLTPAFRAETQGVLRIAPTQLVDAGPSERSAAACTSRSHLSLYGKALISSRRGQVRRLSFVIDQPQHTSLQRELFHQEERITDLLHTRRCRYARSMSSCSFQGLLHCPEPAHITDARSPRTTLKW